MSFALKLTISLLLILILIKFFNWYKRHRRLVKAVEKLPRYAPEMFPPKTTLYHLAFIISLDLSKHKFDTFTLVYHFLSALPRLYPDTGICNFWLGFKPVVILYSPENVESVLTSTSVINKSDLYHVFEPWIGEGLVTSKKVKWQFRRKVLTPAFHFRILSDFLPIINQEATKLVLKLNQAKYLDEEGEAFDITHLIALCTLDTICETAMGVNINCQEEEQSPYVMALHEVGEMALKRVSRPWLWPDMFFYLSKAGRRFTEANNLMHDFATKVIIERKLAWQRELNLEAMNKGDGMSMDDFRKSSFFASGKKRLAFLDLLLYQHLIEKNMSLEDIREEVDTFMFAGHDTTAMCISWTLYMLGLHEDIQNKVREEVDLVLGKDKSEKLDFSELQSRNDGNRRKQIGELKTSDITVEHLREMKYLDRVIKESLRMWPSIPFVARQMTEDLKVDNKYLIPEGATCMIFTQKLHNNPKYFPKPERFDPDRFLPENSAGRHPFAYIPFSAGPRNCIGQKFAQLEVKIILAKVIRNYFIKSRDHRDRLAIAGELVLRSRNGLYVKMRPRFTK